LLTGAMAAAPAAAAVPASNSRREMPPAMVWSSSAD
jgi:hypothetical protein